MDLGTGDGQFVCDLLNKGINAIGVDIYLSERQKQSKAFIEADARKIPIPNDSVDFIYSSFSIFFEGYGENFSDAFLIEALNEAKRILKPRGKIRI